MDPDSLNLDLDPDPACQVNPDPGFWWTKILLIFFWSKIAIFLCPSYRRSSALKREHPALQKIKFINVFLCVWVISALLGPDPSWLRIRIRIRIQRPHWIRIHSTADEQWAVFMALFIWPLPLCSIRQWCPVCGSWPSRTCTPWTGGGRTTCTASWPPSRPQHSQGTDALHTLTDSSPTLCQFFLVDLWFFPKTGFEFQAQKLKCPAKLLYSASCYNFGSK